MEKLAVDQLVDKSDTFTTFSKAHPNDPCVDPNEAIRNLQLFTPVNFCKL
jgi:hypothetical protein